jgi:adenine deaminase
MDFYNVIKEHPNLLEEIQSSKKYDKDVSSVYPGPSAQ